MKKYILTLVILLTTCVLYAQAPKTDLKGKIGISLYGGANIPVNGNISSTVTTTDLTNPGPNFGLGVSYFFTKDIGVEAVWDYGLNFYNDKFKLDGKQPAVAVHSFSINGIYNLSHLFNKISISPYVRAGIGTYNWRHIDDAPWREGNVIIINGNEQKASSFGFNIGVGADYSVIKSFMVGVVLDYNMYFPKDENKFGKDFGGQGNFSPKLKLSYYIPVH